MKIFGYVILSEKEHKDLLWEKDMANHLRQANHLLKESLKKYEKWKHQKRVNGKFVK